MRKQSSRAKSKTVQDLKPPRPGARIGARFLVACAKSAVPATDNSTDADDRQYCHFDAVRDDPETETTS